MISKNLFPIIIFIYFFQYASERNLNYFTFSKVSKKNVLMHHPSIKKSLNKPNQCHSFFFSRGIKKARTNVSSSNRHGEMNLARVLVTICVVFLLCNSLRLFLGLQAIINVNITITCVSKHKGSFNNYVD